MRPKIAYLLLSLCLIAFTISCEKVDKDDKEDKQKIELGISEEIRSLVVLKGDEKATKVIINTQGGPMSELDNDRYYELLNKVNTTDYLSVNVHQIQTKTPGLFTKDEITFDQAISYDNESIEMLYKVIKYFKDQERKVYVIGISFGAFMTQELIAKKGIDAADKYLIMVGRLDMNEVLWKGFSEGKNGYFENGITPFLTDQTDVAEKNMSKLAAGLGRNRYTQILNSIDDLSNVTYAYGKTDAAVGKLTDAEVEFLKSKKVKILVGNGDHGDTIDDFFVQGFNETFVTK